jgi:hypothetical protein
MFAPKLKVSHAGHTRSKANRASLRQTVSNLPTPLEGALTGVEGTFIWHSLDAGRE